MPQDFPNDADGDALRRFVQAGSDLTKPMYFDFQAQPFLPFVVHTADGREYNVPTHNHAHVSPGGGRVSIWTDDETEYILPALLISGLKVGSNGKRAK